MSPNKSQSRGPGGEYVSAWRNAPKMKERVIWEAYSKVWKVEMDKGYSDFECYDKFDSKPVQIDVDKEITERDPTLALLPKRSEKDEIDNNGETRVGDGKINIRKSLRTFKSP